ncbi:YIF1-domain-containing protein [Rhodocollybia butyracea]|uniref:Protein YIF1 n=1 Tax=Rhodocollybia butyracea TaxID=206335 RepID=A0A9P5UD19_9AGAR|nr:YIF1-domain-containing protein [Rhodocollybia butyracea]
MGTPVLQHPVPTHPAYIPEPPSTPGSPNGYQPYMTSPFQHNQHNQQPQPQTYAHPQQPSYVPQPDAFGWTAGLGTGFGMNDATAQFGMQLGSSAVAAGQEYVQKNLGLFSLKHHFNVSNSYVIHKLKLIVFPWTHKSWSRRVHHVQRSDQQTQAEYQDPREDVNSPDLYIPLMAIVTYILISALHSGLQARFHPKILGQSASSALAVILIDFLFVFLGCYLLNVQPSPSKQAVDIVAYSGYKFVGVILTILSSYIPSIPTTLYYLIFFYFFFANGLFLLRSLRSLVLPDPALLSASSSTPDVSNKISPGLKRRRISFLLIEAACQFAYMLFLVRV